MNERRNSGLFSGPGYNRLHGMPPRSHEFNSASLSTDQSSVNDYSGINLPHDGDHSRLLSTTSQSFSSNDPELLEAMRHYGLENTLQHVPIASSPPRKQRPFSEHNQRLATFGVSLTDRLGHYIFAYPLIVLRRQCQVNHVGRNYHLTPFTLFGVAWNMQRAQGLGSGLVVGGITVSIETCLSELPATKLPREISSNSSLRSLAKHLLLKTCSLLAVVPFYSAHLVECVQSEMVSETPGMFSCVMDGLRRLFGRSYSPRMLPFYRILIPTATCAIIKYLLTAFLQHLILQFMRWRADRRIESKVLLDTTPPSTPLAEKSTSLVMNHYPEIISSFMAELIIDVAMFPFETAVNRINIQGTRTIIDNTDSGRGFLPVSSKYEGFWDCFSGTISSEGYSGLYRGFGALTLQYALKYAVARITKFALTISC